MTKPRLNQKVYIIQGESITAEHVMMKGDDSFAVPSSFNSMLMDCYRKPIRYDDYGREWFTKISDAKKVLSEDLYPDQKIVKIEENYWEVQSTCDVLTRLS